MCLHGFALSGHEQSVLMSLEDSGNSPTLTALKASSIFCGISPASNFAAKIAFWAISSVALVHASTECGLETEPCTRAVTFPGVSLKSRTCPPLAYLRPRSSLLLHPKDSRTATQRFDHHVSPMLPRLLLALMPPSTFIGFEAV